MLTFFYESTFTDTVCTQFRCVSFFPLHQAMLLYQLDVLRFNSILTLYTKDRSQFIRSHRLKAQLHKTAPTSHANPESSCYLHFWQNGYKSKAPQSPSLGLINLLKQLIELRKPIYSLDYRFIAKNTNQQPDEEMRRARCRKRVWSFHALGVLYYPQIATCSPTQKLS